MLTEIAITPDLFLSGALPNDSDWSNALWELAHRLAPVGGILPVIVSDLYDGSWQKQLPTTEQVSEISDRRVREKVQQILTLIRKRLAVQRPAAKAAWPESEADWLSEANASAAEQPISRIFCSQGCAEQASGRTSVLGTEPEEFWSHIRSDWSAPMILQDQIERLRPICTHARWLCFVSKFARGNEIRFTEKLIECACSRPANWPQPLLVDVHADRDLGDADGDYFRRKIGRLLPAGSTCRLFLWPANRVRDRLLLAGEVRETTSVPVPRVRWGVSTSHVAIGADQPDHAPGSWTLMSTERVSTSYRQLYDLETGRCLCEKQIDVTRHTG